MADKRPHIAFLLANLIDPFSGSLAKGAMEMAANLDVDLTIFPGKYIGIQHKYDMYDTTYEYQYNTLFDLAVEGGFDYIIAAVGTIAYALDNEGKKRFLDKYKGMPVLSIAADIEGYDSLEFDNRSGISAIIDELAAQGRKHIAIIGGELNNYKIRERYRAYRDGLERNGIPFDEKLYQSSDISEYCRAEAEALIERAPEIDAIVCMNDIIAETVYQVLAEHGRTIGKDVAVTGFDNLPLALDLDPPLATVRADAEGLGARAVEKVINKLRGIPDDNKHFPTEFIMRPSCSRDAVPRGYDKIGENERLAIERQIADRVHIDNIFVRDAMMFGGELKNSYAKILRQLPILGAMTGFIYTFDNPIDHKYNEEFPTGLNWVFRSYTYGKDGYTVPEEDRKMKTSEVFNNKYLCVNRQHCFIVTDLYTAQTQYGIALLEPRNADFFSELELVTYILSSAMRTLNILSGQEILLNELNLKNLALENDSKLDVLTNIYNRRGFYLAAETLLETSGSKDYIVCYADMDDLKLVNDNYGHQEGDRCLKLVADCLKAMFGEDAVIGRLGGDEFAAVIPANSDDDTEAYNAKRNSFLGAANKALNKPYSFGLSVGIIKERCENSYDLRAALDKADDLLYIEKSQKKRRKANI